jgi:flagellar M-ring protein FliF
LGLGRDLGLDPLLREFRLDSILRVIRSLGAGQIAVSVAVLAATLVFLVFVGQRLTQAPMVLLYGDLDLEESGQIVGRLDAAKIPYRLEQNGGQILVPEDQVVRLRMQLAENGLPSGGSVGYEIFDRSNGLGATNFVQNINHLRALEGELARSIKTLSGVQAARVHLVLPRRELFERDQNDPSASIVIRNRGAGLDAAQVRAIQNLVAAAVPKLKPSRIVIVDGRGTLLARGDNEGDAKAATAINLLAMRLEQEQKLKRAIESLLEQSVGAGNVRAEVSADIDFDRVTVNSENFDPDGQVTRSTQTITEEGQSSEGQAQAEVSVSANLPAGAPETSAGAAPAGNESSNRNQRTEELVNYEISKTVKTEVREAGRIRRLSVAVAINEIEGKDADGKPTFTPRSAEELGRFAALVRSAIGYDEKRGDTVEIANVRFAKIELPIEDENEEPGLFDFSKRDMFRAAEIGVLGLISVLALLFIVRPLIARLASGARLPAQLAGPQPAAALGHSQAALAVSGQAQPAALPRSNIEQAIDVARVEGEVKASSTKKIGEIVQSHPEEAAAIVRSWIYQPK